MKILLLFLTLLFSGCSLLGQLSSNYKHEEKVALLIYNENYPNNRSIKTIDEGIRELKSILYRNGFDNVIVKKDLSATQLEKAFNELKNSIKNKENTDVFIYVSGHGVMDDALVKSYVEMIGEEKRVAVSLYRFYDLIKELQARANIIVVDACRDKDTTLDHTMTIQGKNEKSKKIPLNTKVYYSTRNTETSPFTRFNAEETFYLGAINNHLHREEDSDEIFRLIENEVKDKTKNHKFEVPKHTGTLSKKFYFRKPIRDGVMGV